MARRKICSTDIRVTQNIYRSWQSKNWEEHRPYAERAIGIVRTALPILQKHLGIPKGLKIRLASLKGRLGGVYVNTENMVLLDYMFSGRQVLELLCHELVHAEQYEKGRLDDTVVNGNWVTLWDGKPVKAAYMDQPWEVDAYGRQSELADYVIETVGHTEFMMLKI